MAIEPGQGNIRHAHASNNKATGSDLSHPDPHNPTHSEGSEPASTPGRLDSSLRSAFGKLRRLTCLVGVTHFFVVLVAAVLVSLLLDWWFEPGRAVRALLLLLSLAGLGALAIHQLGPAVRMRFDPIATAALLDQLRSCKGKPMSLASIIARAAVPTVTLGKGTLTAQVADAYNLASQDGPGISKAMIGRGTARGHEVQPLSAAKEVIESSKVRRYTAAIALAGLIPLTLTAMSPGMSGLWASRWLMLANTPWPRWTRIEVAGLTEDGRLLVPRGEAASLQVTATNPREEIERVEMTVWPSEGSRLDLSMDRLSPGKFRHTLGPVLEPLTLRLHAGDAYAGPIEVVPIDRPAVTGLRLSAEHWRYDTPRIATFAAGEPEPSLLHASDATLTIDTSQPIAQASIVDSNGTSLDVKTINPQQIQVAWTHTSAQQLRIDLVAKDTGLSGRPMPVTVGLQTDKKPKVTLKIPSLGSRITRSALLPIELAARDDFAITQLTLDAMIEQTQATSPDAGSAEPKLAQTAVWNSSDHNVTKDIDKSLELDVAKLDVKVGQTLVIVGRALDDYRSPNQEGTSTPRRFIITARDDLLRDLKLQQQAIRAALRQARERSKTLEGQLAGAVLPDDQAKLRRQITQLMTQTRSAERGLRQSLAQMKLNKLAGDEAYKLIEREAIKPLSQLNRDNLPALQQSVSNATNNSNLDQMVARQQQTTSRLDDVLRAMDQWDSLLDVINQLNEIIEMQQGVRRETQKKQRDVIESVFDP